MNEAQFFMYPSSIFLCTIDIYEMTILFNNNSRLFFIWLFYTVFMFMFRAVFWSVSDSDQAPPSLKKLATLSHFLYYKFVTFKHCSDT